VGSEVRVPLSGSEPAELDAALETGESRSELARAARVLGLVLPSALDWANPRGDLRDRRLSWVASRLTSWQPSLLEPS
jgi:hypothetical protein